MQKVKLRNVWLKRGYLNRFCYVMREVRLGEMQLGELRRG